MKKALLILYLLFCGCSNKPKTPPTIDYQEQTEKLLACKPDKPLSKGELYERAMVDFFQEETNEFWWEDYERWNKEQEKPPIEREELNGDEVAQLCGLTYDWLGRPKAITKDRCYPYQITKYDNYHDLTYHKDQAKSFEQFIVDSEAKVYRWDKQPPIYKAENYNKDVDFIVIHKYATIYPKDCCKLISYEEAKNREAYIPSFYDMPEDVPKQLNVLMIKNWIFSHKDNGKLISKNNYHFYAVSPCGKILPY